MDTDRRHNGTVLVVVYTSSDTLLRVCRFRSIALGSLRVPASAYDGKSSQREFSSS